MKDVLGTTEALADSDADEVTKTWDLGDLVAGESKVTVVSVGALAGIAKGVYSSPSSAEATNHDKVTAIADVSVDHVQVLSATGFSLLEFISLIMLTLIALGAGQVLRRKMTV